jgi:hypothetical protein
MANITLIQGTDSVSSSRLVINNNFTSLNEELAAIAALFNTEQQTLILSGRITASLLRINNGTIDTLLVNNADIVANLPIVANESVTLNNALICNIEADVSSLPAANSYQSATYVLRGQLFPNPILLTDAIEGQTLTFIVDEEEVTFNTTNINGVSSVTVPVAGSITLTMVGGAFYIVSNTSNTTIVYS